MFKNVIVLNFRTFKTLDGPYILTTTNTALKIYQELKSHLNLTLREQNGDRLDIMPVIQHSDEMLLELTKIN